MCSFITTGVRGNLFNSRRPKSRDTWNSAQQKHQQYMDRKKQNIQYNIWKQPRNIKY